MSFQENMELGVVVERRTIDNPWAKFTWLPVAVLPSAPPVEIWREMSSANGVTTYHAANATLELFRSDTEAYVDNLNSGTPSVYVVLSEDDKDADYPYSVSLITASPYEAQDILDSDEEIVERVKMPGEVLDWVENFLEKHHVAKPFIKRKRDKVNVEKLKFGKEPIFSEYARRGRERRDG